jgi:uracil-DNA glycosylase
VSAETGTEVVDAAVAEVTVGVEAAEEAKAVTGIDVVVPMDRPATIVALRIYRYQDVVQSGCRLVPMDHPATTLN